MGALDPRLKNLLASSAHQRSAEGMRQPAAPSERVGVLVKFTGEEEDLRGAGLAVTSVIGHARAEFAIATGTIALADVEALAALPHVVKVELGRALHQELDVSVEEIRARPLHKATPSLTGRGVVIGIIDTGIDWRHHAFRDSSGASRVRFLWDQSLTPKVKLPADPFQEAPPPEFAGLGVEYSKSQIEQALASSKPLQIVRSMDNTEAHGTHVAGIAAGDGSQAGTRSEDNCTGANTYIGVAPEAELIVVSNSLETRALGESQNLVDAIRYIFLRAGQLDAGVGRPCVINISQGDNLGPHDGTSLVEQAIDLQLLFNPGRAVVKSAGNEGAANHHAMGTVPLGGSLSITFSVLAGDTSSRDLECWYHGAGRLDVTLAAPGVPAPTSPVVHPNDPPQVWVVNPAAPVAQQVTATITSVLTDPDNLDNQVAIRLDPPAGGSLPNGTWTLTFTNTGAAAEEVHCWLDRGKPNEAPVFTSNVTRSHTLSIPGTSSTVITVGNYAAEEFTTASGVKTEKGDLSASSSRGPTRTGGVKPDISAPGVAVTAARAGSHGGCCCDCCYTFYVDKSGTSMAAPHVAGVIALMLQKNRALDHLDIRNAITTTARAPGVAPAPVLPDSDWGFGKIDASAAVGAAPAPAGAGGGGGGAGGGAGGGGGPIAYWTPPIDSMHERALLRRLYHFQEWLLSYPGGHGWAALVSRHFDEVLRLINTNRRVAVVWHRNGGPALLRAALAFADDPEGAVIPETLGGEATSVQWGRILASWRRYATPALRADIDAHREIVLAFPGRSLRSLVSQRAPAA
jgi:subtilisin family serine protease